MNHLYGQSQHCDPLQIHELSTLLQHRSYLPFLFLFLHMLIFKNINPPKLVRRTALEKSRIETLVKSILFVLSTQRCASHSILGRNLRLLEESSGLNPWEFCSSRIKMELVKKEMVEVYYKISGELAILLAC